MLFYRGPHLPDLKRYVLCSVYFRPSVQGDWRLLVVSAASPDFAEMRIGEIRDGLAGNETKRLSIGRASRQGTDRPHCRWMIILLEGREGLRNALCR